MNDVAEQFGEALSDLDTDTDADAADDDVMSYADYAAAALDDEVTVVTYVQAHQSWWDNKITDGPVSFLLDGAHILQELCIL